MLNFLQSKFFTIKTKPFLNLKHSSEHFSVHFFRANVIIFVKSVITGIVKTILSVKAYLLL